jgi:hypothetical protein
VLYIGILDNDVAADNEVVAVVDDEAYGVAVDDVVACDEDHDDDGFEPQQFQQQTTLTNTTQIQKSISSFLFSFI